MKKAPEKKLAASPKRTAPTTSESLVMRDQIVHQIAAKADISLTQAGQALDAFQEVVIEDLQAGHKVRLMGFGTFSVRHVAARSFKAIRTGETTHLPARRRVGFTVGSVLGRVAHP